MLVEYIPERLNPRRISALQYPGIGADGFLNIHPGNQDIAIADLKSVLQNPQYRQSFQLRMDEDVIRLKTSAGLILERLEDIEKLDDPNTEPTLPKSTAAAIKEIEKCENIALLERWLAEDDRAGVEKAINAKLAKLRPPAKEPAK